MTRAFAEKKTRSATIQVQALKIRQVPKRVQVQARANCPQPQTRIIASFSARIKESPSKQRFTSRTQIAIQKIASLLMQKGQFIHM
jgi:hypothetical protein